MHDPDDPALTRRVIGCAIEVHHHLGPGLLEAIYEEALCYELTAAGLGYRRHQPLPVVYKGHTLGGRFVPDLVIEDTLLLELKSVAQLLPVHEAQLITYLRLGGLPLGLLLNFNEAKLKDGIRRRRL